MISKLVVPKSVALIGASASPEKIGYQILSNLISNDFAGEIYPINPKGGEILGHKVFASIKDVSDEVDLAVICIPAVYVEEELLHCVNKGIKGVIIISAGYAEIGKEGEVMQEKIVEICKKAKISLLGPNCLGLINTGIGLNASFANGMPAKGNVSFLSQSGAMVSALIDWSRTSDVGFSKIFSLGNMAILTEAEMLEYLYNDDSTNVIISYFENLKVSKELTRVFIKYAKTKPTIVLFGGKSAEGAKAASSHTGSLVSSYSAVSTYLHQAGVLIADTLEDLFTLSTLFSRHRHIAGGNIAIITNAGGPSIASSDAINEYGLNLATLSSSTQKQLRAVLRPCAPVGNPVDVLGDGSDIEYKNALDIVLRDKSVDGVLVLLTPQSSTKIEETASNIASINNKKPIVSAFVGGKSVQKAEEIIRQAGKACFDYPETAVRALRALYDFSNNRAEILPSDTSSHTYDSNDMIRILKNFHLPVLEYIKVETKDEVLNAANKIGYPIVLKTARADVSHKSETAGVKLNIQNDEGLLQAFHSIGSPAIVGKMIKGKHEIFLGVKKDENIGTVVAFGTGGIYSEIYKDISSRVAPITRKVALEMIQETKMGQILSGARGQKPYDLNKIADIIVATAKFADNYGNISELDFNPIIADEKDLYLVDARIIENN